MYRFPDDFLTGILDVPAGYRRVLTDHRRGRGDEFTELGVTLDDLFWRLEASFRTQRHFIANASHELRTPLTRRRRAREQLARLSKRERQIVAAVGAGKSNMEISTALFLSVRQSRSMSRMSSPRWTSTTGYRSRCSCTTRTWATARAPRRDNLIET